ncbi:MAG: hypothetical protein PHI96_10580 [Desulfovibrio sp.]|nr:hypothetical protein [Desulfovibrio sp.]
MINRQRRNFLRGNWRAVSPPREDEDTEADVFACNGDMLPPEFSPAMLRFEGQRLGLPVDTMNNETLARAVAQAMRMQTRSPVETETPQRGGFDG